MTCRPNDPGSTHYACDCQLARIAELEAKLAEADCKLCHCCNDAPDRHGEILSERVAEAEQLRSERDAAVAENGRLLVLLAHLVNNPFRPGCYECDEAWSRFDESAYGSPFESPGPT